MLIVLKFFVTIGSEMSKNLNGEFVCLVPKSQQSMFLFQAKELVFRHLEAVLFGDDTILTAIGLKCADIKETF